MSKSFHRKPQMPHVDSAKRDTANPLTGVLAGLIVALVAVLAPRQAQSEEQPTATAKPQEESVLVATREMPPGDASASNTEAAQTPSTDDESLEPISQSSDETPDLATESDSAATPTPMGAATAKIIQSKPAEDAAAPSSDATAADQTASDTEEVATDGADAPDALTQPIPFEPVKFQGILVGKSTQQELIAAWEQPLETITTDEGTVLVYKKSPFQAIEVLLGPSDVVTTIKITLAQPLKSKQLAEQLSLNQDESAIVTDDAEQPLGQVFPERGVLFMFSTPENVTPVDDEQTTATASTTVSHVVLQPLDAYSFALRAENRLHGPYTKNISDLNTAISLDPQFAHAHELLAKIYLATGQADLAEAAIVQACEIEPENAAFQLCRGKALELVGRYDESVLTVRTVLDRKDLNQIDRAQALHQMARLASLGDLEIASKTIPFETRAIEIADKLATSSNIRDRRAAKQLLVEAHMAIAEEVARQSFNQKVESLSQWIGRASGLAEEFIDHDGGSVELRLFIAQRALAALASFKPTLDPTPWVAEAEDAAKTLLAQSDDELWQQHIKWELGIAYLNALRVEHTLRQTEAAMHFGESAIENLAVGAASRQAVHGSEQLVGQLYFQMGALYAVHKLDHAKAGEWYEKAVPLLTAEQPPSELYAPRREGEMMVSMGVTFWQLGDQTRALELTQYGVTLVESAVEGGILARSTLAVPYGNLATMYQQVGEDSIATKYSDLAKQVTPVQAKQTSRDGRKQVATKANAVSK